jgi:hypothetical protein
LHASNSIIKFAENTTAIGLITNNDETAYRLEVMALAEWCQKNNLSLVNKMNVNERKELIVAFTTAEGARPYPHQQEQWRRWRVPRRTHH